MPGSAPSVQSARSKRDKTRQNPDSLDTTSLLLNDLQQLESPLSHSRPAGQSSSSSAPQRLCGSFGRQNRTKQNDFRNSRNWTVAPEALTTTPLQIVRFFQPSNFFRCFGPLVFWCFVLSVAFWY